MQALGIDIGGTGIKGAVVDTDTGEFVVERLRIETPERSTPDAVAAVVAEITSHFDWTGPVGCTFPGVVNGRGHPHRGQRRPRRGSAPTRPTTFADGHRVPRSPS